MIGEFGLGHSRTPAGPARVVLACLVALLALGVFGCGGGAEDGPAAESEPAVQGATAPGGGDEARDVADDRIAETSDLPKLLDLGADKCIPCKAMAPILEEMRETFAGRLDVEFIDVWKNRDAGSRYGIKVIPTQIFFDAEGNELFRHQGFFSREDMLAKWSELGYAFEG